MRRPLVASCSAYLVVGAVGALAAPVAVVACSSDEPATSGTPDAAPVTSDAGGSGDAAPLLDAGDDASDAASTEGTVTGLGSFGAIDLSGLTNALSENTSVSQGSELQVVLAQLASCSDVTNGPSANAVFLELSLYTATAPDDAGNRVRTAAKSPGTYNLDLTTQGPYADAYVIAFDSSCHATAGSGKITSGTVTVTSTILGATTAAVSGTYHLMTGGGVVTGTFETAPCTGAYDLVAPSSTATCH